jgi:hypothetical protein
MGATRAASVAPGVIAIAAMQATAIPILRNT